MANEVRLIDANSKALHDRINNNFGSVTRFVIKSILKGCPTIDPETLRPKGRWKGEGFGDFSCSLCCEIVTGNEYNYCPNCGAKMEVNNARD